MLSLNVHHCLARQQGLDDFINNFTLIELKNLHDRKTNMNWMRDFLPNMEKITL